MLQLYALHSAGSWGIGDLGDLREFATWTGTEHGAGAVLLNPLHAITPVPPVQPSPYTPSSRRFGTPLALRLTDLDAYARADPATRAEVDALRPETAGGRIEHDRVWAAKRAAAELLWRSDGRPEPRDAGADLWEFATFCALAERYGGHWSRWPAALRHPDAPAVAAARAELAPRVAFHAWLQQQVQQQLGEVRAAARAAGVTVMHDLAVGCDPEGADGWALQDVLALGVRVGAPPDAFSQQGQDWGLPPWRPDRLAATGYAAYRDLLRALLRQADGLRIDHVAGLWRLWWVPPGRVRGPRHLRALRRRGDARRAHPGGAPGRRAGDRRGPGHRRARGHRRAGRAEHARLLGAVVHPRLRRARRSRCCPRRAGRRSRWPPSPPTTCPPCSASCAASTCGPAPSWACSTTSPRRRRRPRPTGPSWSSCCGRRAWSPATEPGEDELVLAVHALLARARSRLALVSPYDVVGETRQPNLPGTVDQYPNWRLPLPVSLEELRAIPGSARSPTPPPASLTPGPPDHAAAATRSSGRLRGVERAACAASSGVSMDADRGWIGGCGRSG